MLAVYLLFSVTCFFTIHEYFQQDSRFKMKVDTDMVMSVIYSLIMNIKNKDILPYDHLKTFDFMADHLNDRFYE